MEPGIFAYIIRYSKTAQLYLLIISLASFPFYYMSLDLPKTIVNKAIGAPANAFPKLYYGFDLSQNEYLLVLCTIFLILVFINGGFKYVINVYRGIVGERMLRRLRHDLISMVMRFPLPQFRKVSQGEIVSMVTLETEPLGGFVGDSLNIPIYQGGTLLTLMTFMFVQDWILGIAAIALYPVQMWIIPKLQMQVNALGKQRVLTVRKLSERIGETVTGANEIHANDTSQYELADFSSRLGKIFDIRFDIYRRKFFIKFLNNFLAQLTPFFFYSIGGILVLRGSLDIGQLVAVLAAYKEVSAPWKILLTYYQRMEDARIKYGQLFDSFQPDGMLEPELQEEEPEAIPALTGPIVASNVSWEEDDGLKVVNGATVSIDLPGHVALVGPANSGKTEFARLIARQIVPSSGRITIGGHDLETLPEAVTGRRISYVGSDAYLFGGSIRDNLLYGLKHRPLRERDFDAADEKTREREVAEAESSGNTTYDIAADWLDLDAAGIESHETLLDRCTETLKSVGLEEDVFQIGLRRTIDVTTQGDLAEAILRARAALREKLEDPALSAFVEVFDKEKYTANASVAENILFGTPVGETFSIERLGENPFVLQVLEDVGLTEEFLEKGRRLAEIMVELFKDLPPDHEFFERFSFISSDDLPDFEAILRRVRQSGLHGVSPDDQARLRALPFKLVHARHHLDLVDEDFQNDLLKARMRFEETLPEDQRPAVEFFDVDAYNAASTVQDNILFGKRDSTRAESAERVGRLVADVVETTGLRSQILDLGLGFDVGNSGVRLSPIQRQRLVIARALIKRPDLIVLNEATSMFDPQSQMQLVKGIRDAQKGRSVLLVDGSEDIAARFDSVLRMEGGRITSAGERGEEKEVTAAPEIKTPAERAGIAGEAFVSEVDTLAAIPMFAGLDRSKLKLLAFASERFKYDAGQTLFNQGDVGDQAFIIIDGEVDVILVTLDGPKWMATMSRGDLFGELSLLCDAPRSATIKAKTDVAVISVSKDVFLKVIAEDVGMSTRITRAVADRLERTTKDLSEASTIRDTITNLPDARLFADRFRSIAARGRRYSEQSMIMVFDAASLIDFSTIEDEDVRNAVMREIGSRVEKCLRETDTVSRLNDTKFFILLNQAVGDNLPEQMAQRIAENLARPIRVNGVAFNLAPQCEFQTEPIKDENLEKHLEALEKREGHVFSVPVHA